jgi:O-antigen/teichoic acid export membrane protein
VLTLRQDLNVILFLLFGTVIGTFVAPTFLFQGFERMPLFSSVTVLQKLITAILIVTVVRTEKDYILVPVIYSALHLVSSLFSTYFLCRKIDLRITLPKWNMLKSEFIQGGQVFIGSSFLSLFNSFNIVILGTYASAQLVGCYALGEKIIRTLQNLFIPAQRGFLPLVSRLAQKSRMDALGFLRRMVVLSVFIASLMSALLAFTAKDIVDLLAGPQFREAVPVLKILSIALVVMAANVVLANLFLVAFGFERFWVRTVMVSSMLGIVASFLMVVIAGLGHQGASIALVVSEIAILSIVVRRFRSEFRATSKEFG